MVSENVLKKGGRETIVKMGVISAKNNNLPPTIKYIIVSW
jgi:hypothetical protein